MLDEDSYCITNIDYNHYPPEVFAEDYFNVYRDTFYNLNIQVCIFDVIHSFRVSKGLIKDNVSVLYIDGVSNVVHFYLTLKDDVKGIQVGV